MLRKNTYLPCFDTILLFCIFAIVCILGGCDKRYKMSCTQILHANALIEAHPDSTLAILAAINPDSLPENDQMHWYLLHEYASLKLWKPVSPDTIMPVVVDYFQRIGDKKHLCEALYIQGAEYEHTNRCQKAMLCLKEAEQYIPYLDSTESFAGLIYLIQGAIFEDNILYFLASEKIQKALPYFLKNDDYIRLSSCYGSLYDMAAYQGEIPDEVNIDKAIHYARLAQDTLSYLLAVLSKERYIQPFDSSKVLGISYYLSDTLGYARYADFIAEYHIDRGNVPLAEHYLQQFATDTATADWSVAQYHYLHSKLLYIQGYPQQALIEMVRTYDDLREQIKRSNKVRTYLISRQYDLEKEQQKTLRLTITRQRLWITIGAGASGFIIILLIVLFIYHHKRMLHRQKEQAMQANIRELNAELNEKRNTLRQQLYQRMDMAKHLHVDDIPAKLPREVRDYLEQIVFTKEENWQELRQEFNTLYGNLLNRLKDDHPLLTTQDEQVIVLGVLGFSNSDMAFLLNISDRTIWNRRQKIRDRLGDPQLDLDQWFLARNALPTAKELSAYFPLSRVGD